MSPETVLKKGYAAVRRTEDSKFIKSAKELKVNDAIEISFADDWSNATINSIQEGKKWMDSKKN